MLRTSRCSSDSTARAHVADRETLFFSARVLVESLALEARRCSSTRTSTGPTPACSICSSRSRLAVRDVPVLFVALARPELLDRTARLGRRASRVHGPAARAALGERESRTSRSSSRSRRRPRRTPAQVAETRRAIRSSSRSSPPRSSERLEGDRAADERAGDRRGPARLAPSLGAQRARRRIGRRTRLLAWRAGRMADARRPLASPGLTRGHATSSGAKPSHGSRATSSSPSSTGSSRTSRTRRFPVPRAASGTPRSRASSKRRPAVGQSHEALAHHWREAGEHERAVDDLVAAADQAGRGWAKEHALTLYSRGARAPAGRRPSVAATSRCSRRSPRRPSST